jgi:hypothetical protein
MKKRIALIAGGVALAAGIALVPTAVDGAFSASAAPIAATSLSSSAATTFKNCTALNKKYPHGVGKPGAHDKVRGSTKPVTNFKVSASLYQANKKSDRDKDGIACEKR